VHASNAVSQERDDVPTGTRELDNYLPFGARRKDSRAVVSVRTFGRVRDQQFGLLLGISLRRAARFIDGVPASWECGSGDVEVAGSGQSRD
jgi:hypothetical protein